MKKFFILSFVVLGSLLNISFPALSHASDPQASQVVLNWSEFIKLWEESHHTPPPQNPPPVDFILSRAEYKGAFHPNATEIQATFEINILNGETWTRIPFLPASIALKKVFLDGKPVAVAQYNGFHTLVKKGAGQHTLTAVFSVPTPDKDGAPSFSFPISETAMTLLTMSFPEPKLDVAVQSAQVISTKNENGTLVSAILSPSQQIQISWHKKIEGGVELPAKIFSQLEELVTIDESVVRINSTYSYSILNSGFRSLSFHVPSGASILNVSGDGIMDWKAGQGKQGDVLNVQFNRSMKNSAYVQITAEIPLKESAVVGVPVIETAAVEREEGRVAVEAQSSVEVTLQEATKLRQVDVKEIPQTLWGRASNPLLFGFRFNEAHPTLALQIERHEDVPVLTSVVDSANAVTVLTKDGQWITRVSFQVRNHLKQYLLVTLPQGAEVWSTFVSGSPVKPSKDKEGKILIPLQKSNLYDSEASFPVEILYYKADAPLSFGGKRLTYLPTIDLPISQSLWSVYVPEDFTILHFGGNMEKERFAQIPLSPFSMAAKDKELTDLREESMPSVSSAEGGLKKAVRRIKSGMEMGGVGQAFDEKTYNAQARLEMDSLTNHADTPVATENHVLPIAFRVPEVGRVYRFGKIMVTSQVPSVSMNYVQTSLLETARQLFLLVLLGLLFLQRKRLLAMVKSLEKSVSRFLEGFKKSRLMNQAPSL